MHNILFLIYTLFTSKIIRSYHPDNKTIKTVCYFVNNKLHRDNDKPAVIEYFPDGKSIKVEKYWNNDSLHRDGNKPAEIEYYPPNMGNRIRCEIYWVFGEIKRENNNKPSIVVYYPDGTIKREEYWWGGVCSRNSDTKHEPTIIDYYPSGKIKTQQWTTAATIMVSCGPVEFKPTKNQHDNFGNLLRIEQNTGMLSRINNKPNCIDYYENGQIRHEQYLERAGCSYFRDSNYTYVKSETYYDENGNIQNKSYSNN